MQSFSFVQINQSGFKRKNAGVFVGCCFLLFALNKKREMQEEGRKNKEVKR